MACYKCNSKKSCISFFNRCCSWQQIFWRQYNDSMVNTMASDMVHNIFSGNSISAEKENKSNIKRSKMIINGN